MIDTVRGAPYVAESLTVLVRGSAEEVPFVADSRVRSEAAPAPAALPVIPLRELLPWVLFAGAVLFVLYYLIGAEQGATSVFSGSWLHEFVHDGRHLLAFPCH